MAVPNALERLSYSYLNRTKKDPALPTGNSRAILKHFLRISNLKLIPKRPNWERVGC
jgi:hypothetical protein